MRIIYFSPHPTHDIVSDVGYGTHQREMILALRDLGHEVIPVIIGGGTQDELPVATKNQRPKRIVSMIKRWVPGIVWRTIKDARLMRHDKNVAGPRLREALENHKVDLVYERSEYFLGQGSAIASEFGVKHIYEVNAPCVEEWLEFEGASFFTKKALTIERRKSTLSNGFCPVSSPLATFLIDNYSINPKNVQVIPNAINLDAVSKSLDRNSIRKSLGYKETDVIVGFIGAMLPYHGVDLLLEGFQLAQKENENIRLLIIGDGELLPKLERFTRAQSLTKFIQFLGRIKHELVWSHIAAMDICVNPKHSWYGSPIKTFEYGAMGKVVLAPNEGNMRDVLTHNETGYLFDGTLNGLASSIKVLAENVSLREVIGQNAINHIRLNHTWESNAKQMIEFSKRLV